MVKAEPKSAQLPSWWNVTPWLLGLGVMITGFLAWFGNMGNSLKIVSLYQVFPILGIWAWSLMWTHFIIGEIRRLKPELPKHLPYHNATSAIVLALIVLHPGILAIQQFLDGKGLPPFSYFQYAGPASTWVILLGIMGLLGFLFFEIIVHFKWHPKVGNIWWFVNVTQTLAMVAIFHHALTLGSNLHSDWFRAYWWTLGLLLAPCVIHTHWVDFKELTVRKGA